MAKVSRKTIWGHIQTFGRHKFYHRVPKHRLDEIRPSEPSDRQPPVSESSTAQVSQSLLVNSTQLDEYTTPGVNHKTNRETPHDTEESKNQNNTQRWINGVHLCAKASAFIFLLNLALIATAAGLSRKYENEGFMASAVFYRGNCTLCKRWDVALHVIINVLSTCILAASNNCMQALVAPSRKEIDKLHARRRWLDIGNGSVRNLFAVGRYRLALWLCLLCTATPFHLLYNSMVYQSLSTDDYTVVLGPHDLDAQNIQSLTTSALEQCYAFKSNGLYWNETVAIIAQGDYERLTARQCLDITNVVNQVGYRSIIALTEKLSVSDGGDAAILWTQYTDVRGGSVNDISGMSLEKDVIGRRFAKHYNSTHGTVTECVDNDWYSAFHYGNGTYYPVSGCLAIKTREHCELLYSPPICIAMVLASLVKVVAMFLSARNSRSRPAPLLTIGDAVASFLEEPDPTTKGLCWISKSEIERGDWKPSDRERPGIGIWEDGRNQLVIYKPLSRRKFWFQALSLKRWIATLIVCLSTIAAGSYFTIISDATWDLESSTQHSISSNTYYLLYQTTSFSVLGCVVVANMPQLIVTMSYYCFNNILTSMLVAAEYSSYGASRKPLRVTWPVKGNGSKQLSTYWLSLPYAYSIPILIFYMVLHWLVSQSLFYLRMTVYPPRGNLVPGINSSVAYSPFPIFVSLLVGSLMLAIMLGLSLRRFKSEMPLAGLCSAAISAACHPPEDDLNAALGLVKWGETMTSPEWRMDQSGGADERKGHCSFTSFDTEKPSLYKMYA